MADEAKVAQSHAAPQPSTCSVVICTYDRPDALERCIDHLGRQTVAPAEIVVVDASPNQLTKTLVARHSGITYVRNNLGLGTLPQSRKIGFERTKGDVVAYIDDDAYADEDWLENLMAAYELGVGGVGGQARRGQPNEAIIGRDEIGTVSSNGRVTGNFAADPGKVIEIDHMIGCNMSVLRAALAPLGGPPDWPAGRTGQREDLYISLLLTNAGWKLRFTPFASVYHEGAPTPKGQRFDVRYQYEGARNQTLVMGNVYGIRSPQLRRSMASAVAGAARSAARSIAASVFRTGTSIAGVTSGYIAARKVERAHRKDSGQAKGNA